MNIGGLLLGVINIALVAAVLILVGLLIVWFASWMGMGIPEQIKKVYLIIVFLICLFMLVALLLGLPSIRIIGGTPFLGLATILTG